MSRAAARLFGLLALLLGAPALAQPPAPEPSPPENAPAPPADPVLTPDLGNPAAAGDPVLPPTTDPPLDPALEAAAVDPYALAERLRRTEEMLLNREPNVSFSGYLDFGFFAVGGSGAGYVQDFAHLNRPDLRDQYGWVFLGDILAPAVNSRGEAADLGDAPGVDRFDSVRSRGAPGFILSEVNLTLNTSLRPNALVTASVNFAPRTGTEFRLGDFFDLDLAQLEWLPTESQRTSIFVGKTESVLGIEYRDRKAARRFGITPSLIARYTTGTALGLKVRSKFGQDDWLVVAAAVTNGSNVVEQFHFHNEIDSNAGKTVSGRVALRPPVPGAVEVGFSGSWGAQDRALGSDGAMWFVGVDAFATLGPVDLKAQWLKGKGAGHPLEGVYGLDLANGGYLEADIGLMAFGIIGRAEFRDARVWLGSERLYLTKSWRATIGGRWQLTERSILKAEFLRNGEYGDLPKVRNDVFTTSLVLSY